MCSREWADEPHLTRPPVQNEPEQPATKKGKTQKQGKAKTTGVAIEFDEEKRPSVIGISSNTTENENPTEEPTKDLSCKTESDAPKETNISEKVAFSVKATTSWQIDRRVSERKHAPANDTGFT